MTVEELVEDEDEVEVNLLAKELHELISSKIREEIEMDEAVREAGVGSSFMPSARENLEHSERDGVAEQDGEDEVLYECEELNCVLSLHFLSESEDKDEEEWKQADAEVLCPYVEEGTSISEEAVGPVREDRREDATHFSDAHGQGKLEFEVKREAPVLPDCLLLMMCEPKLSMEVSRETWVCSNDFLRWLPEHPVANRITSKVEGGDDLKKKTRHHNPSAAALTSHHERILQQPPRNSCSFPVKGCERGAADPVATTLVEQRLVSARACEPLVLKRCKSEPMRVAPDACLLKSRKMNNPNGGRRPVVSNIVKAAKLMAQ
ncbi:hypothetical protein MLD38_035167 [Melastoma candidum]|nr:hypothetical protein MLD38_035167 [Melastoma candidum]